MFGLYLLLVKSADRHHHPVGRQGDHRNEALGIAGREMGLDTETALDRFKTNVLAQAAKAGKC